MRDEEPTQPANAAATLVFRGVIAEGCGQFAEMLEVPGRHAIAQAPPQWPNELCRGTLNVRIPADGFPTSMRERGLPIEVRSLDLDFFSSCFTIAFNEFCGTNTLVPNEADRKRGSAQVWRATLGDLPVKCWVLRRYGSNVGDQLEIVSAVHLKNTFDLKDGEPVTVTLYAGR